MSENVSAAQLLQFIERLESLESDKSDIMAQIKDTMAEAKGVGFCTETIRQLLRLRAIEKAARDEAEALLETYREAIGLR